MKRISTTLLFLLTTYAGWSQIEMKLKPRFSIHKIDSLVYKRPPLLTRNSQILNVDSSRFIHSVPAGSIYTLPLDNMPWLKSTINWVYNMPVQTVLGNDNMPNGYLPNLRDLILSLKRNP